MSSVNVTFVKPTISVKQLTEFFSFCGKVENVNEIPSDDPKFKAYEINFSSPKAVSTALLLNDAEIDNSFIRVTEVESLTDQGQGVGLSAKQDGPGENFDALSSSKGSTTTTTKDAVHTGDKTYDDVDQEEKPKYAILAQLLAEGYVVSDQIIDKGIEFDKKNGYSQKFQNFLENLDKKYIHSKDPNSTVNQHLTNAQDTFEKSGLYKYFEDAANSSLGLKIHQYYKSFAKDAKDVHEEAVRLAKIKKAEIEKEEGTGASTTGSTTSTTTPTVKA
ncbi:hypothetical protein KGF54_000747 [Candida jiufengensis]|uniref:uncharacterized protein n=1 Tax=Candida jiufengensis TaxID=497108 RepID=UPI00222425DE|nr:uncharacterized protein KGF54_000747 [Candida jiufengensis]KAI5956272.1 hypothetical protein KGF54_000747 [Candida jiufengensis]